MALGGRVGTGNIAGVATAIGMGGPRALFWMWVIAYPAVTPAISGFAVTALLGLIIFGGVKRRHR